MIIIYIDLIQKYVNHLSISDLKNLAKQYSITYTEEELDIIYHFIKEEYMALYHRKIEVFQKIKSRISPTLYHQLLNLYTIYSKKII